MKDNITGNKTFELSQYTNDLHKKIAYNYIAGRKLLDIGCGTCVDSLMLKEKYNLNVYSTDIYKHKNVDLFNLNFKKGSILNLPYASNSFDYVFLHDVLHHVDEDDQSYDSHLSALNELKRVCKKGGTIIILEGNRYNPLFYPHMVKMLGHNHWKQGYFKKVITTVFDNVEFKYFEAHLYPKKFLWLGKIYEFIMERISPKLFLAYNMAVVKL
ncbi:class I SAM-dependent methyltransferase [Patescibacteria group bacterium]|nr:class I SAM-dependent methyltransferase [Patescibacteria group bacterium]